MKRYLYRIYNGAVHVDTWGAESATAVLSDPTFSMEVDGSIGPLELELGLGFDDVVAGLTLGYEVLTYCIDDEAPEGTLIHAGWIERIHRTLSASGGDRVHVSVEPYASQLARDFFMDKDDATAPAKTWTSTDVTTILTDILNRATQHMGLFSRVHAESETMQTSGKTVSIQVGSEKYLDAIRRVKKLGPGNFYWFINPNGIFRYTNFDTGARHVLTLGREIENLAKTDDITDVVNALYFWNMSDTDRSAIALERPASPSSSQLTYGRRSEIVTDSRVDSEGAALAIADAYLTSHEQPTLTIETEVSDSTANATGYDIERLTPGDTVELRNVPSLSGQAFSLTRVDYAPDRAKITLAVGPYRRSRTLGMSIGEIEEFMTTATNGSIPSLTTA